MRLMPEFRQRLQVLQMLNYVDDGRAVLLKGRVARELNTVTCSLLATEIIFDNALDTLEPEEIVAMFSCLVFEEKGRQVTEPSLTPTLQACHQKLQETAKFVLGIQRECCVDVTEQEYMKNINIGLMEVVFEWGRGLPFSDICTLTDVQEGTIVRCIIRLDETCREIKSAARLIGDSSLFTKMEEASEKIKRDIVFATSLYVS
uniref:ATP-dependent RNA helicase Ski2/MTR4 C-terminal domain-containing protein n=1 Tax=Paramoeba aestuarina TaxID=180227 RepID=A0A7S4PCN3_9EUKA